MKEFSIDNMPELVSQLGKAKADRIRYHQKGTGRRQPGATNITNPLIGLLVWRDLHSLPGVNDILTGIARSIDNRKPLSTHRMFNIIQLMSVINTREIQRMTGLSERQARKYMQATKMALPLIEKHLTPEIIETAEESLV